MIVEALTDPVALAAAASASAAAAFRCREVLRGGSRRRIESETAIGFFLGLYASSIAVVADLLI